MLKMRTPGSVVFLAMPSKGTTTPQSASRGSLIESVYADLAVLHERHPDITFVSPMVQDYCIVPHLSIEPVWSEWGERCKRLMERCDEVWVLMYDGWSRPSTDADSVYNTSTGVAAEMKHATECKLKVHFIDPTSI